MDRQFDILHEEYKESLTKLIIVNKKKSEIETKIKNINKKMQTICKHKFFVYLNTDTNQKVFVCSICNYKQ